MANPPVNINQLAPWTKVLGALETDIQAGLLPCVVQCPSCRNSRLFIYQDTTHGGQWHYCRDCKTTGDMIQLAAKVWHLPLQATVERLARWHLPELRDLPLNECLPFYERLFINAEDKAKEFWNTCSKQLLSSVALRQLRLNMGLLNTVTEDVWATRGGQFIGSATRRQVDAYINYNACDSIFQQRAQRIKRQEEVVVIPFYDLPGRISAFLFCLEEEGKAVPIKYVPVWHSTNNAVHRSYPGLGMLEALHSKGYGPKDTVFVFLDPLVAVKAHIRHLSETSSLLPLVAVYPSAPTCPYLRDHAPTRDIVLWAEKWSIDLFKHAKAVNGRVVLHDSREPVHYYLRRMSSKDWMIRLSKIARPWETVLEEQLAALPTPEAEALLFGLEWSDEELPNFIKNCEVELRQKLEPIYRKRFKYRQVLVNGHSVVETDRGWELAGTGELICDAPFYIQRVITYPSGKNFYQGHVRLGNHIAMFTAPVEVMEKTPFAWLKDELLSQRAGLITYNKTWQQHAVTIAARFHQPEVVAGIEHYGWDEQRGMFVLPNRFIEPGGKVTLHGLPTPEGLKTAAKLPAPAPLENWDVQLMSRDTPETHMAWALVAFVAHNLLHGPLRHSKLGLLYDEANAEAVTKLAEGLGCVQEVPRFGRTHEPDHYGNVESSEDWPVVYKGKVFNGSAGQAWYRRSFHNAIVEASWYARRIYSSESPWLSLEDTDLRTIHQEVVEGAARTLMAFILDALKCRFAFVPQPNSWELIKSSVADWFERNSGDPEIAWAGLRLVKQLAGQKPAEPVLDVACRLLNEGQLTFTQTFSNTSSRHPFDVVFLNEEEGDKLWLSKVGLNKTLTHLRQPPFDLGTVSRAFAAQGILLEEKEWQGTPGWIIPEATWNLHLRKLRGLQNQTLRIVP